MTPNQWNRSARDSVVSLLLQAGYSEDSSVINQLGCMNFDAPAEPDKKLTGGVCRSEYKGGPEQIAELVEALEEIQGLTRWLREGGPDHLDLVDLSEALEFATDTAHAALTKYKGESNV